MKNWSQTLAAAMMLGLMVFTFSCKKDQEILPSDENEVENVDEHLSFLEVEEGVPDRMELINLPLMLTDTSLERSACRKTALWAHVAEISTLKFQGINMSATHVAIVDDLALVSYHLRGDEHKGAVEVVDLKDPDKPKITSQAFFLQADVNAVAVSKDAQGNAYKVWVALSDSKNGAVLGELELKNKKFQQNYYRRVKLAYEIDGEISPSANAIAEAGEYLYVTAGRVNGGIFCLQKNDMSLVGVKQFKNAKGVATNEQVVACLQASEEAVIYLEEPGKTEFANSYSLNQITHQNVEDFLGGKTSLDFDPEGKYLYVAAGASGLKIFDPQAGQVIFDSPVGMLENGNTNGVTLDGSYAYVANGADGLAIFEMNDNHLPDISHVFLWDLNEKGASANFVESNGDWVFVAKGEGGFKILKKPSPEDVLALCSYDAKGKPQCLTEDAEVCPSLMAVLNAALPVNGSVKGSNPGYLTNGLREIILKEDATVELVFLSEHTSATNPAGYYTYPVDCQPASEEDLVGLVAFPNFSGVNSGGALTQGNTIQLHGTFKANTALGFFLVPQGWDGSKIKKNQDLLYANPQFNSNPNKHGLIFYSNECDAVMVAFDQQASTSNNADFRDAVFMVKVTPPSAVDFHDFIQL